MSTHLVQFVGGPLDGERLAMTGETSDAPAEIPFGFIPGKALLDLYEQSEAHRNLGEPLPDDTSVTVEPYGTYHRLDRRADGYNRYAWREDPTSGSRG